MRTSHGLRTLTLLSPEIDCGRSFSENIEAKSEVSNTEIAPGLLGYYFLDTGKELIE